MTGKVIPFRRPLAGPKPTPTWLDDPAHTENGIHLADAAMARTGGDRERAWAALAFALAVVAPRDDEEAGG